MLLLYNFVRSIVLGWQAVNNCNSKNLGCLLDWYWNKSKRRTIQDSSRERLKKTEIQVVKDSINQFLCCTVLKDFLLAIWSRVTCTSNPLYNKTLEHIFKVTEGSVFVLSEVLTWDLCSFKQSGDQVKLLHPIYIQVAGPNLWEVFSELWLDVHV